MSIVNDDLPLPDTPVTTTNWLRGIRTVIFFKLLERAPTTTISFLYVVLLTIVRSWCLFGFSVFRTVDMWRLSCKDSLFMMFFIAGLVLFCASMLSLFAGRAKILLVWYIDGFVVGVCCELLYFGFGDGVRF